MKHNSIRRMIYFIAITAVVYLVVTTTIGRLLNPELTETELFLKIPDHLMLNFNK